MKRAIETSTELGGDCAVPIAFRIIPNTIANRTNDVVDIKKNGAKLIEDIAINKLIDELNWSGSINEFKLIFNGAACANT